MTRKTKLQLTPITTETFKRQGWGFHEVQEYMYPEDLIKGEPDDSGFEDSAYFCTLPIPKERKDKYAPLLVSNTSNDLELLKEIGLKPGQFFIEIFDFEGLGVCTSEEELEVLYKVLTGKNIEDTN
jgi:hypothetical protein